MKKTLIHYVSSNQHFLIQCDDFDTTYIIDVSEKLIDEIPSWCNPMDFLVNLFADFPISKINYIDENFDINSDYLEDAINEYLEDSSMNQKENFLKSLGKITAVCNADSVKQYLKKMRG